MWVERERVEDFRILLFFFFICLPVAEFPLVCHNLRVVCSMKYNNNNNNNNILTMGFGTLFPVSKKINIEVYDIEELWGNEACGGKATGRRILCFLLYFFCLLPVTGFPLVCHN